jgi:hypothetical protein
MEFRVDRSEFKYVIPLAVRDEIIAALKTLVSADEHGDANAHYPIISQYYDSIDRACYWEKQEGLKHRRKLRVRVYGQNNGPIAPTAFIEVKHKSDSRGVKRRLNAPMSVALALADGESRVFESFRESRYERMVVDEIRSLIIARGFQPNVAIRYDRLAFQGGVGRDDLRITFDYDLRCRFRHLELTPDCQDFDHYIIDRDLCIMELKTIGSVPIWLCKMLSKFKLRPQSFSKYCNAIEKFDPEFVRSKIQ